MSDEVIISLLHGLGKAQPVSGHHLSPSGQGVGILGGGLDDERRRNAEKQVREWASVRTLPFPELAEDYRKRITDTLDYLPEGSPEADRG